MDAENLQKVLRRMIRGEKKAFDIIFTHYHRKIYFYCLNHFYTKEEAEEIVQEIFVKLWLKKHSLQLDKNFEAYLFTIAKNHILNDLRKKLNQKASMEEYHLRKTQAQNYVDEEVMYNELENQVYDAINRLPEKRQEIFILSRIEGLSNKEIAEKLNISIKTVETQMKLALDYFKKVFSSRIINILLLLSFTYC